MPPDGIRIESDWDDDALTVDAVWSGEIVGHAWGESTDGARLLLVDLKVEDEVPIPYPFARGLLVFLGVPCRKRSFRGRGIGSMLVRRVISEARAAGIKEIRGSVTRDDMQRTPYLLEWYGRMGFVVTDADSECIPTAVKKITMRLDSDNGRCA